MTKQNSIQEKFKKDALRLAEGPHLAGYVIQHSDTYRLLIIDGAIMRFTPTEYALLLRLLQHSERHLSFAVLEQCLFLRSLNGNPRSALIRHMRRIRPKLWPFGLDILSITGYGYMLHATRQELATVHALETVNLPAWSTSAASALYREKEERPSMKKAETMEDFKRTPAQPLLLSIPDVATSLGLGRSKVYELIAKEGLPVIRFGRSVRVSAASLQKWVEQREQHPLPQ